VFIYFSSQQDDDKEEKKRERESMIDKDRVSVLKNSRAYKKEI